MALELPLISIVPFLIAELWDTFIVSTTSLSFSTSRAEYDTTFLYLSYVQRCRVSITHLRWTVILIDPYVSLLDSDGAIDT